jgi:glutamate dehydrogenase
MNLRQVETSNKVVPWFFENMPPSYFRQVDEELRKQHLNVIISAQELGQSDLTVKIKHQTDADTSEITYLTINQPNKQGQASASRAVGGLSAQIKELEVPSNSLLSRVKVFTTKDGSISLNIFTFESKASVLASAGSTAADAGKINALIKDMKAGTVTEAGFVPPYSEELFGTASMNEYFKKVTPMYCEMSTPRRFLLQRALFEKVRGTDRTEVFIEKSNSKPSRGTWFTVVSANIMPQELLQISSSILSAKGLNIGRAHLDTVLDQDQVNDSNQSHVTMLRLLVDDHKVLENEAEVAKIGHLLKRGKWLDDSVINAGLVRNPELGVDKAEVLFGFYAMLHGPLADLHPQAYASVKNMHRLMESSPHVFSLAGDVAGLFLDRFKPDHLGGNVSEAEFRSRLADLKGKINVLHHEAVRTLLAKMCDLVQMTFKTNFYLEDRYSFAVRVDPAVMVSADKPMPFGLFFAAGRNFQFFHNRFRDIARGGLRVVTPPNSEQHSLESSKVFSECYGLSYAQQLKNKDIPEGGSKAVCLVNTPNVHPDNRYQQSRLAIHASVDAILDLTVASSTKQMKDLYQKQEVVFLGPDEQVVPSDCDWICHRAGQRGYPYPMAFMSSKVGAGINHKEYGVTSEGVAVYLESALKHILNLNPRTQPFSVKITGGPDGDVGGNLLKILHREFPKTCKVVGVADGMGVAEDPNGLNMEELVRLFKASQPITFFDAKKLSAEGIVMKADNEEGIARRNTMVFRVKSDIFVPAGGRPGTINGKNWKQFLLADGKTPSSPLIVEGANIFTTPEARQLLFEHAGVAIVKDSSANKCGVVTSSCEVATSILLSTPEFLQHKDAIVADVIKHLHMIAKAEAELLFREYKNYPGALPHFSERISNAINLATDCITDLLKDVKPGDPLWEELKPLVRENLPAKLAEVGWSRAEERFPVQYMKNSMASTLASRMVYQEGIHLIETQPVERLAERAISYYKESKKVKALLDDFKSPTKPLSAENRARIELLLKKGGTRSSCEFF